VVAPACAVEVGVGLAVVGVFGVWVALGDAVGLVVVPGAGVGEGCEGGDDCCSVGDWDGAGAGAGDAWGVGPGTVKLLAL